MARRPRPRARLGPRHDSRLATGAAGTAAGGQSHRPAVDRRRICPRSPDRARPTSRAPRPRQLARRWRPVHRPRRDRLVQGLPPHGLRGRGRLPQPPRLRAVGRVPGCRRAGHAPRLPAARPARNVGALGNPPAGRRRAGPHRRRGSVAALRRLGGILASLPGVAAGAGLGVFVFPGHRDPGPCAGPDVGTGPGVVPGRGGNRGALRLVPRRRPAGAGRRRGVDLGDGCPRPAADPRHRAGRGALARRGGPGAAPRLGPRWRAGPGPRPRGGGARHPGRRRQGVLLGRIRGRTLPGHRVAQLSAERPHRQPLRLLRGAGRGTRLGAGVTHHGEVLLSVDVFQPRAARRAGGDARGDGHERPAARGARGGRLVPVRIPPGSLRIAVSTTRWPPRCWSRSFGCWRRWSARRGR